MYSVSELSPNNGRKSFCGKAHIIQADGTVYLRSYDTIVASVTQDGVLHKHWDGWSATTGSHIASFSSRFAGGEIRKNSGMRFRSKTLRTASTDAIVKQHTMKGGAK